jgi:hypothetical protein
MKTVKQNHTAAEVPIDMGLLGLLIHQWYLLGMSICKGPALGSNPALLVDSLQVRGTGAGLLAAAAVGMVPSYISRSVAGSFDNEGVAIFALVNVFYLFVKVGASHQVFMMGRTGIQGLSSDRRQP